MGTTTSSPDQTSSDVDAILAGMRRPPPAVQPGYTPPMPPQIQPRPAPASAFGPGAFGSSQPQSWPNPANNANVPAPPPARSDDSGSGLTPSPYSNQPSPPATPTTPTPATLPGTQVAANRPIAPPPPRFQQGNQPGPWPAAFPNSPQINLQNPPVLPGETPQETAALNRFMGRESQGQNIINSVAAKNPESYFDPKAPRTASGYWQMVNSTWATAARLAGVDTRQYPTAMSAPYQVQRQVALALYRSQGEQPWAESVENRTNVSGNPQQPLPPQPRGSEDWGSAPPRDFGPGPTGQQGPFGQAANMQPGQSGFTKVLNSVGPLLLGIASLALRLPLSTAITAYGAMARAQDNGQREAYERARTQFQDQLNAVNAQQALESREASDAYTEYGNNNPQGLQQTLAQIALKYNDPIMYRMAERGDLNGIHQLQTKRDLYNQDLTKLNRAAQDEQDRKAQDDAVAAMDRKYAQEHPNATPDELAIAHVHNLGQVQQEFSGKQPTGTGEDATPYNVVDKTTGQQTRQVRMGRNGGLFDLNGQATQLGPNEQLGDKVGTKTSDDKLSEPKAYDVVGSDGKVKRTVNLRDRKSGPGFEDAETGQPFTHGPDEQLVPHVAQKAGDDKLSEPKTWDVLGPDNKVRRTITLRDRKGGPGFEDAQTGEPFTKGSDETLVPHEAQRAGTGPRFGTVDDLMQRWHDQFVKDNNREPSTDEISKQRQNFAQESKPPTQSARQVSQRLGIAIGEAAGGIDALSMLSSNATLGPWGGAQAALSTNSFENFGKSLANKVTPTEARMLNSIASVIARPLASVEAAGVATGLVGVTDSLRREFPQSGDDGYTVLTKMANLRNIIDAAADQLVVDKTIAPEIRDQIAHHRAQVDAAIPYTLNTVVAAEVNPTRENMRGLAERLLHRTPTGPGGSSLPPGVTVEVK